MIRKRSRKIASGDRKFDLPTRGGGITLEYVMVLAILFPAAAALLMLMIRVLTALYDFSSATIGWLLS